VHRDPFLHNKRSLNAILLLAGLLSSLFLVSAYLFHPPFVASTNNRTTDAVMALAQTRVASDAVVIVDIDDASLARYGQWPWPRSLLAQLLTGIKAGGAASIGLDFILAEPDRTSPAAGAHSARPGNNSASEVLLGDNDLLLAKTLTRAPFVLGYEFSFKDNVERAAACDLHPPGLVWVGIPEPERQQLDLFTARDAICNLRHFSDNVTDSGFLNAAPDTDGILRRFPMIIRFEDQLFPSLGLAMLMQMHQSRQVVVRINNHGGLDLGVGDTTVPVDTHGAMLLPFVRQSDAILRISAADLLGGQVVADTFQGKLVIVGFSAAGLEHLFPTPAGPIRSHAELHAQVLVGLIAGHSIVRTATFLPWEALAALLITVLAALAIVRHSLLASAAINAALLVGCVGCAVFIVRTWGLLVSPLLPAVLLIANFVLLTIIKIWKTELDAQRYADNTLMLLKSSEKNLHSIIKTIPDIIFRLDSSGCLTFISSAVAKYTDSVETMIGRHISEFVPPDQLPHVRYNLMERRTGTRATSNLELQLRLPSRERNIPSETRFFSVSAEGIYEGETPTEREFIGTQGILRDITERKKLEEQLVNAQKLEVIGSLAAGVAHDLNNILAGLVTYPELLLLELPKDSPLREKIALIQDSGKSAAAIVQDLLTLARRGARADQVLNINTVITGYLASIECATTLKHHPNVTVEHHLAPDPLLIKGSRVHLIKTIMNLLTNAAEAMPAGGRITISTSSRYVDLPLKLYEEIPPGAYVCIRIVDEGIGIAEEDQRKIFEPFFSKKSMKRSGSGLGMTVIWVTVKDHGGFIDLQSREGEGATVELFFPATREQEESVSPQLVLEDYVGTEQVLIVDDSPVQLQIADNMLTKLGYKVTTVTSGESAVKYVQSHAVDLVVLDMIMPGGLDGLETYEKILEIRPGQRAIITSGFSEPEKVTRLQQLGAGEYVQKPYTLGQLGLAVRKELDISAKTTSTPQ
jgi:PAS domain S-box-containing protein